nr:Dihydrofolate reductase [uncultured bacterium]
MISLIAAIGANRAIGKDNRLLWDLPQDRRRFWVLTKERPVIMGRKTWESKLAFDGKPFGSGRTNIVVTSQESVGYPGAVVCKTVEEALAAALKINQYPYVIGGENIYLDALRHAEQIHLTLVDDAPDAHAFFPYFENLFEEDAREEDAPMRAVRKEGAVSYRWAVFKRRRVPL